MLIQVDVENLGAVPQRVAWTEVFGSLLAHLDPAWARRTDAVTFTATHYESAWRRPAESPSTVLHSRTWKGLTPAEQRAFNQTYRYPIPPGGGVWDKAPPSPFLAAVSVGSNNATGAATATTTTVANDAAAFFGAGGPARPVGAMRYREDLPELDAALIVRTELVVPAHGRRSVAFIWGYVPHGTAEAEGAQAEKLVARYRPMLEGGDMVRRVAEQWKPLLARFTMPKVR